MKWLAGLPIGGQRIDVHLVAENDPRLEGGYALFDPDKSVIYIWQGAPATLRNKLLFHELDHAVNESAGVNKIIEDLVKAPRKRGPAIPKSRDEFEENMTRARAAVWPDLLVALGFQFPKGPTE